MPSESATESLNKLGHLAGTCNFGDFRETVIRVVFVIKLRDKKLLAEENLTLLR